jgi:predicted permease
MSLFSVFRHASRRLRRAPSFAVAATVTLALGIGGAVAVFTLVDGVLLKPLPYPHADRLVDLSHTLAVNGVMNVDQSDATYLLYHQQNHAFTSVALYRPVSVNLAKGADAGTSSAERVAAATVTPSLFDVLPTTVIRGRRLTDADGVPGAPPVAVIGAGLWQRAFGADPAIVGQQLLVNGVDRTVVGIVANDFRFPDGVTSLWLPLVLDPANTRSAAFDYRGVARLKPGMTIAAATADLARLLPQVPVVFPGRLTIDAITATHMAPVVRPLRAVIVGDTGRTLWIVFGAVGLLLAIACANVAGLFVARAEGRRREFAVRRALGAGRIGLLGDYIGEAVLLSIVGGTIGLVAAAEAVHLLGASAAAATIPRLGEIRIDGVVVLFTAVVTLLAVILVSIAPAARQLRVSVSALLTSESTNTTGSSSRQRMRRVLVMSQLALALVLLAGAGLFMRSFARLSAVDPGFQPARALAFRVELPTVDYRGGNATARSLVDIASAIDAIPGVQAVGVTTNVPLDNTVPQDSAVYIEDHPRQPGQLPDVRPVIFTDGSYFAAMRIPLLAGRTFNAIDPSRDSSSLPREMIVSAEFARRYWTVSGAVGKRIRLNPIDPWSTIVGVAGSVHDAGLDAPASPTIYVPLLSTSVTGAAWAPHDVAFVVRGAGDVSAVVPAIRSAVAVQAPSVPIYRVVSLVDLVANATSRTALTMLLLGIAAIVATLIGATGIYGVVSYLVSLRTREIGVRLALGARPADVKRLVIGRVVVDAAAGIIAGLIGAVFATRLLAQLLFGVAPADPVVLSLAVVVLLTATLLAAWAPARRAARVEPSVALRSG